MLRRKSTELVKHEGTKSRGDGINNSKVHVAMKNF